MEIRQTMYLAFQILVSHSPGLVSHAYNNFLSTTEYKHDEICDDVTTLNYILVHVLTPASPLKIKCGDQL